MEPRAAGLDTLSPGRALRRLAAVLAVVLWMLGGTTPAFAASRLSRAVRTADGAPITNARALAQDETGFIWIGTIAGLFRWDGQRLRRWAPQALSGGVVEVLVEPGSGLVVRTKLGDVYAVGSDAHPVAGPGGPPLSGVLALARTDDGSLWALVERTLWRRAPDGSWSTPPDAPARLRYVAMAPAGPNSIYFASGSTVHRVEPDAPPTRIAEVEDVIHIAASDGRVGMVTIHGVAYIHARGETSEVLRRPERGVATAWRGDTLWVAHSGSLTSIGTHSGAVTTRSEDGLPSGGPLLVDREGTLWMGTFTDLLKFPEPETVAWTIHDGLRTDHTRSVTESADGIWVATWDGQGWIDADESEPRWHPAPMPNSPFGVCTTADGTLWTMVPGAIVERREGLLSFHPVADLDYSHLCARAPDGTVWLASGVGLFLARRGGEPPLGLGPIELDTGPAIPRAVGFWDDHVWAAIDRTICRAPWSAVARSDGARWRCSEIEGAVNVFELAVTERGNLWAATEQAGVQRWRDGAWERVPASAALPSAVAHSLQPSPRGGLWVAGAGFVLRVADAPDSEAGWDVLEKLTSGAGLPTPGAADVLERDDGSLWLATAHGVVHVPATARSKPSTTPRVIAMDTLVAGNTVAADAPLELPHRANEIEVVFAALTYREQPTVGFRFRLSADRPWRTGNPGRDPRRFGLHLFDLPHGDYALQVSASQDGQQWSDATEAIRFSVETPWFLRPSVWVLGTLALAGFAYAAHRVRLGVVLRAERERIRIARDLHDEMGAGLGRINVLAGLAERGTLSPAERGALAGKISSTAQDLGTGLRDIVWNLRHGDVSAAALADQLVERGAELFAERDVRFNGSVELGTALGKRTVPAAVSRNLYRIALEAMHNAATHARPTVVALRIEGRGSTLRLCVQDDGIGLHSSAASGGMGLRNMQERAGECGAVLRLDDDGGGTRVVIELDLDRSEPSRESP